MRNLPLYILLVAFNISCSSSEKNPQSVGIQSQIIEDMIESVNAKDADNYVKEFDADVQVYLASELKITGSETLRENRAKHFRAHPNVRSEIQHMVEIDNKVILHDKVWLDGSTDKVADIVEIFTFENNKVVRMEVIQPKNLFK